MRINLKTGTTLLLALAAASGCSDNKKKDSASTAAPATSNLPPANAPATPVGGATVRVSQLAQARGEHSATATPLGVVVAGGEAQGKVLDSIEVYLAGKWSSGGKLAAARKGHSATLLSSGRVLIAGGQSDQTGAVVLDSIEIYDPLTRATTAGPKLSMPRTGHVAVAFRTTAGEQVLIAGGLSTTGAVATAEVYDVARGAIVPLTATLQSDRVGAEAVALQSGKLLIQGGIARFSRTALSLSPAGAELFDPQTMTFAPTSALGIDRFAGALATCDTGEALVFGGNSAARVEDSAEAFDPATGQWHPVQAKLSEAREELSATALKTGELFLAGGSTVQGPSASVDMFRALPSAQAGVFLPLTPLREARKNHAAARLDTGNVLLIGGNGAQGPLASVEEYDPFAQPGATPPTAPIPPVLTPVQPPAPPAAPQPAPRILAILPDKGKPGDLITIAGQHFAKKKADNQVLFAGGVPGKVLFEVAIKNLPVLGPVETLVVEVPAGAQTGDVSVLVNGQTSSGKGFRIDLQSGGTPQVLYTLPRKADVGSLVTIFGRNFARPASDNVVKFAGVPAQLIGGITTQSVPFLGNLAVALVRVPAGARTGQLTIEAYGKVSGGYSFEVSGTTAAPAPTPGTPTSTPPSNPSAPTPGARVLYSEDFEGATVAVSQQGGVWQAAQVLANVGPGRAASGQWCAGTSMTTGTYAASAHGYMMTREIDLSGVTSARLRFNQFFDTDGADAGRVIVSPDGGNSFYLVRPQGGYGQTSLFSIAEGFTGQSGAWLATTCDISRWAGSKLIVVFEFKADAADQRVGWYVDDIVVEGN